MTNPRHFDHLESESFDIIDSEHIPLFCCWYNPFFEVANRLLKPDGILVYSMGEMFSTVKNLHPIDRESLLNTPIQNGFCYVENSEDIQAVRDKMTKLRNKAWEGICFRKKQHTINNHAISSPRKGFQHLPNFELLLSKCTTFFDVVMYSKAAIYINTIKQNYYTQEQIRQLHVKKIELYGKLKTSIGNNEIPTIDDAKLNPEKFYLLVRDLLDETKFKELTGGQKPKRK